MLLKSTPGLAFTVIVLPSALIFMFLLRASSLNRFVLIDQFVISSGNFILYSSKGAVPYAISIALLFSANSRFPNISLTFFALTLMFFPDKLSWLVKAVMPSNKPLIS